MNYKECSFFPFAFLNSRQGLLLLTLEEIHRLCHQPTTLEQYVMRGGNAMLSAEFDTSRILEPFVQLRLLSRILSLQSGAKGNLFRRKETEYGLLDLQIQHRREEHLTRPDDF